MDCVNVERDEQIAAFDVLTVGDVNFKVLAVEFDGVDTNVHEQFRPAGCDHADSVFGREDESNFAVARSHEFSFGRLDSHAVTHGARSKSVVGHFVHQHHASGKVCAESFVGHLGFLFLSRRRTAAAGSTFKNRTVNLARANIFDEFFKVCFDDCDGRSVNDLNRVALDDDAARARGLEDCFIDFGAVDQRQAQTRGAAVNFSDVIHTADARENRRGFLLVRCQVGDCRTRTAACHADTRCLAVFVLGNHLHFFVVSLAPRRLQIPFHDKEFERDEVEHGVDREDRQHHHPVGFCLTGQDAVEDKVNQAVGEGGAHCNSENVARREGKTRVEDVNHEKFFREEKEREFDRLSDTGEE